MSTAISLASRRHNLPFVYQMCKDRNFVTRKHKSNNQFTHTVLDGAFVRFGPVNIPLNDPVNWLDAFYREYVRSLQHGQRLYFVEWPLPGHRHRMYFDFDMYFAPDTPPVPIAALHDLFRAIQHAIAEAIIPFDDDQKMNEHDQTNMLNKMTLIVGSGGWSPRQKLGLHLIWRDIWVDTACLPEIRRQLVDALQNQFGDGVIPINGDCGSTALLPPTIQLHSSWDKVVDEHIAKRASSRMFGSAKLDWCDCKKRHIPCTHERENDKTRGRIDVGRIYEVATVVTHTGEPDPTLLEQYRQNMLMLLHHVSLCTPAPPDALTIEQPALAKSAHSTKSAKTAKSTKSAKSAKSAKIDDDTMMLIKRYIKSCYNEEPVKIESVGQRGGKPAAYRCTTTCRRCFNNFDQEHTSACCYFVVSCAFIDGYDGCDGHRSCVFSWPLLCSFVSLLFELVAFCADHSIPSPQHRMPFVRCCRIYEPALSQPTTQKKNQFAPLLTNPAHHHQQISHKGIVKRCFHVGDDVRADRTCKDEVTVLRFPVRLELALFGPRRRTQARAQFTIKADQDDSLSANHKAILLRHLQNINSRTPSVV